MWILWKLYISIFVLMSCFIVATLTLHIHFVYVEVLILFVWWTLSKVYYWYAVIYLSWESIKILNKNVTVLLKLYFYIVFFMFFFSLICICYPNFWLIVLILKYIWKLVQILVLYIIFKAVYLWFDWSFWQVDNDLLEAENKEILPQDYEWFMEPGLSIIRGKRKYKKLVKEYKKKKDEYEKILRWKQEVDVILKKNYDEAIDYKTRKEYEQILHEYVKKFYDEFKKIEEEYFSLKKEYEKKKALILSTKQW